MKKLQEKIDATASSSLESVPDANDLHSSEVWLEGVIV